MAKSAEQRQASDGYAQPVYLAGQERNIAVLSADLRSFTGIAERKLPYDLVLLLNNYFETVGEPITDSGGLVDKFIGDGVMEVFQEFIEVVTLRRTPGNRRHLPQKSALASFNVEMSDRKVAVCARSNTQSEA